MEARGWDVERLAKESELDPLYVWEILENKRPIHGLSATALGEAFGTSGEVWHNLQDAWDTFETGISRDGFIIEANVSKERRKVA